MLKFLSMVAVTSVWMYKSSLRSTIVLPPRWRQSAGLLQERQPFSPIKANRLSSSAIPVIHDSLIYVVDVEHRLELLSRGGYRCLARILHIMLLQVDESVLCALLLTPSELPS